MKFKAKTKAESKIPTSSMPDIIFMLLIFFMVTTVLREYEGLNVFLPQARKIERFLSQPFFVAEVFTNAPGKYVPLSETIRGFKGIVNGDYDDIPEQAFYMTGNIDEVVEKAKTEAA